MIKKDMPPQNYIVATASLSDHGLWRTEPRIFKPIRVLHVYLLILVFPRPCVKDASEVDRNISNGRTISTELIRRLTDILAYLLTIEEVLRRLLTILDVILPRGHVCCGPDFANVIAPFRIAKSFLASDGFLKRFEKYKAVRDVPLGEPELPFLAFVHLLIRRILKICIFQAVFVTVESLVKLNFISSRVYILGSQHLPATNGSTYDRT